MTTLTITPIDEQPVQERQPRALRNLFFTELWERFCYYGMRALFILYMTEGLLFGDEKSYAIYGAYGSLIYATPLIGGMIADRLWGCRRTVLFGGILMALGEFSLTFHSVHLFYLGLALLICGNGFLKPNISSLLGKLYRQEDPRRNAGFTLFYVGVNIGGFLAPICCGYVGATFGWRYGFGLAGVGMLIGLFVFVRGFRFLGDHGLPPDPEALKKRVLGLFTVNQLIYLGSLLVLVPLVLVLLIQLLDGYVLAIVGVAMVFMILTMAFRSGIEERKRIFALMIFMIFAMAFWSFNEQAGSSLNLFTERNIDRHIFGYLIPAAMFQSVNPGFIFIFGPVLAAVWMRLGRAGREPSTAIKFGLALIQLGVGFAITAYGAVVAQHHEGLASMWWYIFGVLLMTTGELCLEPVGISLVTKISPAKVVGLMMGCWYLVDGSFSNYTAGWIASLTSVPTDDKGFANPMMSAIAYAKVFHDVAIIAVGFGLFILILTPWLNRMIGEHREKNKDQSKENAMHLRVMTNQ